jgi:hypothetical protein
MAKEKPIGEQRRIKMKIDKFKMYKDHGNHFCVHVAFTEKEAGLWKDRLKELFSTHVEKLTRSASPTGIAYAIYIHG